MNTLKSILLGTFIAVGGVVLALNAETQVNPLCTAPLHEGYTYPQGQIPPEDSSPTNLPENMDYAGRFETPGGFSCTTNISKTCHWVYNPTTSNWIPCEGNYVDLP